MPMWDETSGALQLGRAVRLYAHMPLPELQKMQKALQNGDCQVEEACPEADEPPHEAILFLPQVKVPGGRVACVCFLRSATLHAVEMSVVAVGRRKHCTAAQQRAFLFQCLRAVDPARDSRRAVILRCLFGTVMVATDPHSGDAMLRLTYR